MAKRVFFGLMIFVFMVLFASCKNVEENKNEHDKNNETEQIDEPDDNEGKINFFDSSYGYEKEYILVVGDSFNPFVKDARHIEFSYKSSNDDILSVDEDGIVTALSEGSGIVEAYVDGKYYGHFNFQVKKKETVTYNFDFELFNEFQKKIARYDSQSSFVYSQTIKVGDEEQFMFMQMRLNPFYYELRTQNARERTVEFYREENNRLFSYEVNEKTKYIKRELIEDEEGTENSIFEQFKSDGEDFDYDKIEFNKIDDKTYQIKIYICDYSGFNTILASFGLEKYIELFKDSVFMINYTFDDYSYTYDSSLDIHFVTNNQIVHIPIILTSTYYDVGISEFDTSDYEISAPKSLEEVYTYTDLSEFELGNPSHMYCMTHLKPGRYVFDCWDSFYLRDFRFTIYDKDLNKLNLGDEFRTDIYYYGLIFKVEEEGDYYFSISCSSGVDKTFKLIEIKSIVEPTKDFTSSSGTIYNKFDYKKYVYTSNDSDELIKITNNSSSPLYFYTEYFGYSSPMGYLRVMSSGNNNSVIYIKPRNKVSTIYVVSSLEYGSYDNYQYTYDFTVEVVSPSNCPYEELGAEYGEYYYLSGGNDNIAFLLNVLPGQDGDYKFYIKNETGEEKFLSCQVCGKDYYDGGFNFTLNVGSYIVILHTSTVSITNGAFRYRYYDYRDKNVEITLNTIHNRSEIYDDIAKIETERVREEQLIKYYFTLEKPSILVFNPRDVEIHAVDDTLLSCYYSYADLHDFIYQLLDSGRYYILFRGEWYFDKFSLAIEDYNINNYFDINGNEKLIINNEYSLYCQNIYEGIKYLEYVPEIDERIKLIGQNVKLRVYDKDLNIIQYVYDSSSPLDKYYELKANEKYYIIAIPTNVQDGKSYFSAAKVE